MNISSVLKMVVTTVCSNYLHNGTKMEVPEGEPDPGCILRTPKLMEGKTIRIGTLENPPLTLTNNTDGALVGQGVIFEIVDILKHKLGFSYEVVKPESNILGDENHGIIGLVHKKQVDVAVGYLPQFSQHAKLVQHSESLAEAPWVFLMKRPLVSASGTGLLAPFDATVWYLVLASVVLMGPAIYFIILVRVRLCAGSARLTRIFPLSSCVWFVYGALMKQGSTLMPVTDSSRLLFATWWIFITLLTSFYTANLTAFLTLSRFTLQITDLKDISTKKAHWAAQKGSAMEYLVYNNDEYSFLNLSLQAGYGQFVDVSDTEMLLRIKKDDLVYLREKQHVEHTMFRDYLEKTRNPKVEEKDRCTFVMTKVPFLHLPIAFYYPLNSSLAHIFDPLLKALVETGIVRHLLRKDLPQIEICPLDLGSKERQLRNSDLYMTYMIVVTGFCAATVAFFGEILTRQVKRCIAEAELQAEASASYPDDWKTVKAQANRAPYTMYLNGNIINVKQPAYSITRDFQSSSRKSLSRQKNSNYVFQYTS
ncbi:ionotropic receptor 93a [Schistocerca americana]|uniref:ionotropic receptor 93a n=1 Tax=Schistocerca americana TaxID=7009 RepID=UPI001F4F2812|nr:ionotropic receptor 93a [Schistocerca americana]XP_047121615.1 ionotropic receptor 93a [Schistocerca piceifrons]